MAPMDVETEKTLFFTMMSIAFKNLCELLIGKGVITAEEYKKSCGRC